MAESAGLEERAAKAADNAFLKLASRIAMIALVPLVSLIFYEIWNGLKEVKQQVGQVSVGMAVLTERMASAERRTDELRFQLDRLDMRRP